MSLRVSTPADSGMLVRACWLMNLQPPEKVGACSLQWPEHSGYARVPMHQRGCRRRLRVCAQSNGWSVSVYALPAPLPNAHFPQRPEPPRMAHASGWYSSWSTIHLLLQCSSTSYALSAKLPGIIVQSFLAVSAQGKFSSSCLFYALSITVLPSHDFVSPSESAPRPAFALTMMPGSITLIGHKRLEAHTRTAVAP